MNCEKKLKVKSKLGLHARPAAMFVETANKYLARVEVRKEDLIVDGKSILNILMLGVEYGDEITVVIDGEDAEDAMRALEAIILREDV